MKQLGISNCYDLSVLKQLHHFASVKPAVVQNRFYADTDYDVGICAFCREQGISYQSFWTLTANPHVLEHEQTRRLAGKYQVTPGSGPVPLPSPRSTSFRSPVRRRKCTCVKTSRYSISR